ncbi:hypothetical protein GCM10022419_066060 [Nonomuraea rosea]|uniref:MFS transporter n=2 Tax=Nonomuraea rosea TaxID=638574 RepID=A0ABP6Y127_9ACTN
MRAALVGAVVGLTQFLILCWRGEDIGILDMMGLIVVPYALGFFLSRFGRLPNWGAVATLGPAITALFLLALVPSLRFPPNLDLGDWQAGLAFMALGATSYLAAGGLAIPMHTRLRFLTVGLVAVTYVGVGSAQGLIADAVRAQRMTEAEMVAMVPVLPGYRLTHMDDSEPWLTLEYESDDIEADIDVAVGPKSIATPKAACGEPVPEFRPSGTCKQAAPGVWVRTGETSRTAITTHGDALLQVESRLSMPEADLIAILRTFHPIDPWELSYLVED